jgi:hypothetical protein
MATLVNTGSQAQATGSSSLTINSPSATAGNTLVLIVSWILSSGNAATPSAPSGWTAALAPASSGQGGGMGAAGVAVFYKTAAGGTESPSFSSPDGSGNMYANAIITEWSGMGSHDTNDSSSIVTNNTGGASTGTTVPNSGTLAAANSTVFTALAMLCGTGLANANFAVTSGYTSEATDNNTSSSAGTLIAHKTVSSNVAINAVYTWTSDVTILSFQAACVVFSDSGGGSFPPVPEPPIVHLMNPLLCR